jgi:hypothetical protein
MVTEMGRTISKAEAVRVLRRAGYSTEIIQEIDDQLSDPIDLDCDAATLSRYGITREHLMEVMGGSP